METVARHPHLTLVPQPDPLVPALAQFLADRSRPASVLADWLPSPVLSDLEAYMSATLKAATLQASTP